MSATSGVNVSGPTGNNMPFRILNHCTSHHRIWTWRWGYVGSFATREASLLTMF